MIMDDLALERYFDDSIANDSSYLVEEDPCLQSSQQQPHASSSKAQSSTHLSGGAETSGKLGDDLDLSFLPDDLSNQSSIST
ncbi:hypothetical protein XENOCAPTIV_010664, partial [Xenoophorus captivus]